MCLGGGGGEEEGKEEEGKEGVKRPRRRRRGGGEHGHCDTIKEGNAKSSFRTLNQSIWDEFLIVSLFLESLIRSLERWPHCWHPNVIIIY